MKFDAIIKYSEDRSGLKANHPARAYLRTFLESGELGAAGPFSDDAGALWVLDADSAEAAEAIVRGDPLVNAGIITSWTIRRLAYWSAQEAKGAQSTLQAAASTRSPDPARAYHYSCVFW